MDSNIAIDIKNVSQSFKSGFWLKEKKILKNISFSVKKNTVFGFIGPNGAGKTTLIHLLVGARKPKSGGIKICGQNIIKDEAKKNLGYLPEQPDFYKHLTGSGFLYQMGILSGLSSKQTQTRMDKVLKLVHLKDAKNLELKKYSKGMLQRIGIAQSLLHDPEVLILDEPMSGLDPIGRKELREMMGILKQEGKTLFFSTHIISDIEAVCDQVGVIYGGEMKNVGPIGSFLSQGSLETEVAFAAEARDLSKIKTYKNFISIQGGYRIVLKGQKEVNSLLGELLENNITVLWVTPIRSSLESFFE